MKRAGSAENIGNMRDSDPFQIRTVPEIVAEQEDEPEKSSFRILVLGEGGKQAIVSNPTSKDLTPF